MKKRLDTPLCWAVTKVDPLVLGVLLGPHGGLFLQWISLGCGLVVSCWVGQRPWLTFPAGIASTCWPEMQGSGHDSQWHPGSVGKGLDERSRGRCLPLGHLCIFFFFLENSRFWKVAWFSLPLKGGGVGDRGSLADDFHPCCLIRVCDLGQVHSKFQCFSRLKRG